MFYFIKRWFFAVVWLLLMLPFSAFAEPNVWEVVVIGLSEKRASTLLVDFRDGKYWINRKDAADIGLDTIKLNKPNNGSEVNLSDYGTVSVIEQKAQVVLEIDMKYRQETLIWRVLW